MIREHFRLEHFPILRRVLAEHGCSNHAVLIEPHVAGLDLGVLLRFRLAYDIEILALARR